MKAWVITLPKDIEWSEYEKELAAVADRSAVMRFRVPRYHKTAKAGDRCYVCHRGVVKGWMEVTGLVTLPGFTCEVTGKMWQGGKYIERSGPFHAVEPVAMRSFQGIRGYAAGVA